GSAGPVRALAAAAPARDRVRRAAPGPGDVAVGEVGAVEPGRARPQRQPPHGRLLRVLLGLPDPLDRRMAPDPAHRGPVPSVGESLRVEMDRRPHANAVSY